MELRKSQAPELADIQRWLLWIITDPRGVEGALANEAWDFAIPSEPLPRIADFIVDQAPLTRNSRLDIYAEAYFSRIHDVLVEDFATVFRAIGHDRFHRLVGHYLARHPSRTHNAVEIGRHFPAFLKTHEITQSMPSLPDIAALDWASIQSYFAEDSSRVELSRLGAVPEKNWPRARFELASSVEVLFSDWNIDEIWRQKELSDEGLRERVQEVATHLLVYRFHDDVWIENIGAVAAKVLELMRAKMTLGEIGESVPSLLGVEASQIESVFQECFGKWIANGVVSRIYFPS